MIESNDTFIAATFTPNILHFDLLARESDKELIKTIECRGTPSTTKDISRNVKTKIIDNIKHTEKTGNISDATKNSTAKSTNMSFFWFIIIIIIVLLLAWLLIWITSESCYKKQNSGT